MCYKYHLMVTSPADYPSLIPYIFSLSITNNTFSVADYSQDTNSTNDWNLVQFLANKQLQSNSQHFNIYHLGGTARPHTVQNYLNTNLSIPECSN